MNEVRKTHAESMATCAYVAPHAKVVCFQPEGMLCVSMIGLGTEKFEEGYFDWN